MSRKNLFLIISVCLVGAIFVFAMNRHFRKVQASGSNNMYQEINSMALAAQSGDQTAIGNLVDTIFSENEVNQLDPNLVSSLKDRIVRAESNGQMVSETQVVQALNWLTGEFSTPTYARTSLLQTRALRLDLNSYMPNLFVDKDSQGNVGLNKTLNSQPSSNIPPTQAVTLLIVIVHQKMFNLQFQKDPVQWDSDFYAAQQSGNFSQYSSDSSSPDGLKIRVSSQKNQEIKQLVYGSTLTSSDIERIAQGTLDQLGIPR